MTEIAFKPWPKTPRFFRDITITEKIDGTNGGIQIHRYNFGELVDGYPDIAKHLVGQDTDDSGLPVFEYLVVAQSRKRIVTPHDDNAGFGRWVWDNAQHLVDTLGTGTHFGEWWGKGIQRGYDQESKRFSLFNTAKWRDVLTVDGDDTGLGRVPVLYEGPLIEWEIQDAIWDLEANGSYVAEGYMNPEGIVIYHSAANEVFKVLLENDELPKGAQ